MSPDERRQGPISDELGAPREEVGPPQAFWAVYLLLLKRLPETETNHKK